MTISCADQLNRKATRSIEAETSIKQVYKESFKTKNEPYGDRKKYFSDIAWLVKKSLPEIRKELSAINNELGSNIEMNW